MRFGSSAEFAAEPSIAAVFAALDTSRADFGVVPVENSTEGSVTLTLDLLIDTPLVIIGEVLLPIRHALHVARAATPAAIRSDLSPISSRSANAATIWPPTFRIAGWRRWPPTRLAAAARGGRA